MTRLQERIENFNRAFDIYSQAVVAYNNDCTNVLYHMALIQTFEVCFELAWKILKDFLSENGINKYLPKEVIKEAFSMEIIKDGQLWIDMLKDRNASSHEYNSDKIDTILKRTSHKYYDELTKFSKWAKSNG